MKEVIVVSAVWCSACQVLKRMLKEKGVEYKEMDADSEIGMDFCQQNGVRSLPTTFLMEDGFVVDKVVGSSDIKKIEGFISV